MTKILAYLKQVPIIVYLVVAGITLLFGGYKYWAHVQQEVGKRELQIVQYEIANRDLRREADSLRNAYRVDTVRLTRLKLRTDTLTATVERWKHDTVRVVRYVVQADSTIKACTQALSTCETRVLMATRGWDGARDELKVLKASFPSPVQKWRYGLVGVGVGLAIGYVAKPRAERNRP